MTEQELRESLISVAPSAIYANESEIVAIAEIAKAYADAQVAAKDAEIKRLREGVEELRKLGDDVVKHVNRNDLSRAKMHASRWDEIWNKWRVYIRDSNHSISPAPVTEGKFSVSAYPKECVPTIEQPTENDGMSMMERLEKRMPPFHGIDSPKNEDQK